MDLPTPNSSSPISSSSSPEVAFSSLPSSSSAPSDTGLNPTSTEELTTKKRLTSAVWNHFKRQKINGEDRAICNFCKKQLSTGSKHGTNHLHSHFKSCPRRTVRDIRQQLLIKEQNKGDWAIKGYSFDQDKCRSDLAEMIVLHGYPLTMVEHHGFRKLLANLQPLFKVPSRNTIKSDMLKIYDFEKVKTLSLLENNESRIALTTDMWTATNQRKGFMALTTHFIDDNWTLQSRIIRFVYVRSPHTSKVIANVIAKSIMDWNLDRNISTLIVDNCSTNDSIISNLLLKLDNSALMLGGSLFHMRCAAHILNLVVQDGLNVIASSIEKIRESVAFWRASPKRKQKFDDVARVVTRTLNVKKLVLDCKTRWNSTYLMLSTALSFKEVFARLKFREPLYKSFPTDEEWILAEEVCDKLKIFYSVTEMFSGTKYPTANVFFPKVVLIKASLLKWILSPNELISSMAQSMLAKFDKYWSDIHGIMGVATVLDPRYKKKALEYSFKRTHGDLGYEEPVQKILKICYDLLKEYKDRIDHDSGEMGESQSQVKMIADEDFWMSFNEEITLESESGTNVKTELDHYLEDKVVPRNIDLDILDWWKNHGYKYPALMKMARDVLAIPISTVASESAFSTSGRLISPHRSRLHPKTLEALMCAQSWLSNEIRETCSNEGGAYCRSIEYDEDTVVVEEENKMSDDEIYN